MLGVDRDSELCGDRISRTAVVVTASPSAPEPECTAAWGRKALLRGETREDAGERRRRAAQIVTIEANRVAAPAVSSKVEEFTMATRVAIDGFGRIGRDVLRAAFDRRDTRLRAGGADTNTVAALNDWPIQPLPGEPPLTLLTHKRLVTLMAGRKILRHGGPAGTWCSPRTPNSRRCRCAPSGKPKDHAVTG